MHEIFDSRTRIESFSMHEIFDSLSYPSREFLIRTLPLFQFRNILSFMMNEIPDARRSLNEWKKKIKGKIETENKKKKPRY